MKKLLLALCLFPFVTTAQSIKNQSRQKKNPEVKTELFKSSRKLQNAGACLGVGGGLLAVGSILAIDADTKTKMTAAKVVSGGGGLFCLVGGILIGGAGESLFRSRDDKKVIAFTGNALSLTIKI